MKEPALAFETIKSLDDLNRKVAAATAAGKPVMLDFYADWCTSCKEMERYTFSDKSVQSALSNAVLLHADVTANDRVDQELMHHFNILGPPTIAFYGPDGEERQNFRVVGYMKANDFASLVTRAIRPTLSAAILARSERRSSCSDRSGDHHSRRRGGLLRRPPRLGSSHASGRGPFSHAAPKRAH